MKLTKIMEASSHDQKTFHRLIKDQRTNTRATKTYIDGCSDPDEAASKWKDHFENLATPKPTEPDEGSAWNTIDDMITKLISFNKRLEPPRPLCSLEVLQAIRRLNRGKAPDTHGVSAEHLVYADLQTADLLTSIFNAIIRSGHIPQSFKDGVITPIYKGGGKPIEDTDSYIGITISSIIGKVLERILADHQDALVDQSNQQYGFTCGISPAFASVKKPKPSHIAKQVHHSLLPP